MDSKTRPFALPLEEITPMAMRCGIGSCPAVYRREDGKLVIVGAVVPEDILNAQLPGKVGAHEAAIVVDPALLSELAS